MEKKELNITDLFIDELEGLQRDSSQLRYFATLYLNLFDSSNKESLGWWLMRAYNHYIEGEEDWFYFAHKHIRQVGLIHEGGDYYTYNDVRTDEEKREHQQLMAKLRDNNFSLTEEETIRVRTLNGLRNKLTLVELPNRDSILWTIIQVDEKQCLVQALKTTFATYSIRIKTQKVKIDETD